MSNQTVYPSSKFFQVTVAIEDLLENGCICYTRADWIADEITKSISLLKGTWIGDIENIESTEYGLNSTRYVRNIVFRLKDVNIGKLIQNG